MGERMGAWMDERERERVEQEADGKGRQETGQGKEGGQEGMQSACPERPVQRGMLALPHFCSPLQGVSVPRDQSSPHCRARKGR